MFKFHSDVWCFFRLYFFLLFRVAWNFWLKVDIMSGIIETEVNRPLKVNVLVAQSCLVLCNPVVCAWNSLGKNIRGGWHSLLQGIFPSWGRSWLSCKQILHHLSYKRSPNRPFVWGFMGFPGGSVGKESTFKARDAGSIPVSGRSPGGGHSNPL